MSFYWNLHAPYDSTPQIIDQTALEYKLRIDPTRFFRNKASSKSHTLNNTKKHKTETRLLRILISCTMHSPMKFFRRCQRSSLMRWIDTRTKQHEITRSRRFSFRSNSSAKSGNYPSPHKPRPPQLQLPSDHRPRTGVRWGLTGGADPSAREQGTTRAPPPSSCGGGDPTSGRVAGADPAAGRCAVRVPRWRDLCAFFPLFV